MQYNLKTDLSIQGLNKLAMELDTYVQQILPSKVDMFLEKLADKGIIVAQNHLYSTFRGCVDFSFNKTGFNEGELVGKDNTLIHRVWYKKNGDVSGEYDISPILMGEFGAGKYAPPEWRGTLGKNGLRDEWHWYDAQGVKHSSEEDDLIKPTHPMHNAYLEMARVYREVAQEVFK